MKLRRFIFLVLGLCLLIGAGSLDVVRAITTTETDFLQEIPLQISAYSWQNKEANLAYDATTNPRVLRYVQLYNSSDELINMSDWQLLLQDSTTALPALTPVSFSGSDAGWLEPGKHVVASYAGSVQDSTLVLPSEVLLPNLTTTSTKVKLIVKSFASDNFRDAEYNLKLDSANSTSSFWQRNFSSTGEGYLSTFVAQTTVPLQLFDDGLYATPNDPSLRVVEVYPYSSDCAPNDATVLCGDYIKLHVDENVDNLADYVLRTDSGSSSRTTSNTFWLGAYSPSDEGYITVYLNDDEDRISLTNSGGYVWIEDLYGKKIYENTMAKYDSASSDHQGWSYALDENDAWRWTSTPQPDMVNKITVPLVIEQVTVCPSGKYMNPETGRCRTIEEAVNALAACAEGEVRNPETNRCRKLVSTASVTLTPCGDGQERNPLTNRCRSIASAVAELLPCDEGYERNPETNRCRKVAGINTLAGIDPASQTSTVASVNPGLNAWGWALASVAGAGAVGYAIYEWRNEISKGYSWLTSKLGRK